MSRPSMCQKSGANGYIGDRDIKVCVVDSGIDYTHPGIVASLRTNPKEIQGNGVDDDGDGMFPGSTQLLKCDSF
jgi:subtilisin family serine protease